MGGKKKNKVKGSFGVIGISLMTHRNGREEKKEKRLSEGVGFLLSYTRTDAKRRIRTVREGLG